MQQLNSKEHKMVILAEGSFGILESKAATVLVRYHTDNVIAVIDSEQAGKDVSEVIEIGEGIPVLSSLAEAMETEPNNARNWNCAAGRPTTGKVDNNSKGSYRTRTACHEWTPPIPE